jgi:hypothetical protein
MDRLELVEVCSTINSGSMAYVVGQRIGYKVGCNVKTSYVSFIISSSLLLILLAS